jgi:D-3-phosphoglycerate dehydrogenase
MIDQGGYAVDLQAAGGLETENCRAAVAAGATSLPLGGALHREQDMAAFVAHLRSVVENNEQETGNQAPITAPASPPQLPIPSYRVLVASRSWGPHCPQAVERMQAAGCELIPNGWGRAPTENELIEHIADVDVLISGTEPVTARVLDAASRLKVISKHGVGYENIDLQAAKARGIPVTVAGGAISDSVADMTWALLLALTRQVPQGDRAVRDGQWLRMVGMELSDKTLGIVGMGQIGKAVCRRAKGFGMHVAAYDLYPDEQFSQSWGVHYLPLHELLASADIVSLHAPVTPETRQLINGETLALIKRGAYLVNTARGELVDEAALADALRTGQLAGAASDVFVHEPPNDNPLLMLPNFIATPHSAGQTDDGLRKMGEITAENALRVLAGAAPLFRVA